MTNHIRKAIEDWTGEAPLTCPWRSFFDPFVRRVVEAYRFFEDGNLAVSAPDPSHRLVQGIAYFHGVQGRITKNLMEQERKERQRQQAGR